MSKKYRTYKPSGVRYLGDLPGHWQVQKFGRVSYMKGRIGWQGLKQSEFTTEGPYLITGMNFKDGKIRWEEVYHITNERYDEAPEIQLQEGDVLMTKDGTIGKLLFVDYLPGPASLNSHLLLLRPLDNCYCPKYLYYQLQSQPFLHYIEISKTGTTFYGITQEAIGEYKVFLPPIEEQQTVVKYLDKKTVLIDETIQKKKRLINLLQEERTALINQAVTRGLNSDVQLKPSGVEWLGDVPEHWKVKRLKFLVKLRNEKAQSASPLTVALENIESWTGRLLPSKAETSFEGELKKFQKDDVLFNKLRPYLAKVIQATSEGRCVGELLVLVGQELTPRFLFYRLLSSTFIKEVDGSTYGSKMPRASWEDFISQMRIPYPHKEEQEQITSRLDIELFNMEKVSLKIEQEISLLKEYRTALINEVVTGKRCVVPIKEEVYA